MATSDMEGAVEREVKGKGLGGTEDWVVEFGPGGAEGDEGKLARDRSSLSPRSGSLQHTGGGKLSMDLQDLGKLVVQTAPLDATVVGGAGEVAAPEEATQILKQGEQTQLEPGASEPEKEDGHTQVETQQMVAGVFGESKRVEGFKMVPGMKVHKYELVRMLGRGGMGTVWAAYDTKLGRKVAIKFLHAKASRKKEFRERFLAEARATAQFNHENIVTIYDAGEYSGSSYLVLEHLDGEPLSDSLKGRTMPYTQALQMMIPVVRALVEAHAVGIVHRDLKPDNIFVLRSGGIKVLDFGLAKLFDSEAPEGGGQASIEVVAERMRMAGQGNEINSDSQATGSSVSALTSASGKRRLHDSESDLTEVGAIMGTYAFMSPEQWGMAPIDHLTDLWAVGVILFRMITGEHPFGNRSTNNIMANIMRRDEPVRSVRELATDVPDDVADVIGSCLQKKKESRIASAEELLSILEGLTAVGGARLRLKEGENPYLGLAAFTERDANRFFGRDAEIAQFIGRLKDWPTLAVIGPSGAGKSSFVRAGVIPTLRSSESADWDIIICRPGRDPFAAISGGIHAATTTSVTSIQSAAQTAREEAELAEQLRAEAGHLGAVLRARARNNARPVLVYVDQFEELYTMVEDPAVRAQFAAALAGVAVDSTTPVRMVLSMRSDFLDRVSESPELMNAITRELTILQQPGPDGLHDAIVRPAALAGFSFDDPKLVDEMVNSLVAETAALPLLQFAAQKLWEARDIKGKLLTRKAYEEMGGVEGALVRHADSVIQGMSTSDRTATRLLFQRLVTPEGTRAILSMGDLHGLIEDDKTSRRLLHVLTEARLLVVQTTSEDEQDARVEIVHESLITRWATLQRWLDEGHEDRAMLSQLRESSRQWQLRKQPPGLLWTGEAIDEARLWRRRSSSKLTPVEEQFLNAGLRLADRAVRRRRLLVTAAIVTMATVTLGAVYMTLEIRSASVAVKRESDRAKMERKRAVIEADRASKEARRAAAAEARALKQMKLLAAETKRARSAEALASKRLKDVNESQAREEQTQGHLKKSYKDLETALKRATKARRRADEANKMAQLAAQAERRLRKDLEVRLRREREENRRLRKMRVKLIQSLPVGRRRRKRK